MPGVATKHLLDGLRQRVTPLTGDVHDLDLLIERAGRATFVLLGEASHGTHEFYKARAEITKRLIREHGFTIVALEADWPDALRIHRFIQSRSDDATSLDSLADFKRFPAWMWRNADMLDFVGWLRNHNETIRPGRPKVGVYGLDLYSLFASMDAVVGFLEQHDPEAAEAARQRYGCFEGYENDPQNYGLTAGMDRSLSCEEEVVRQLAELQRKTGEILAQQGRGAADEVFFAKQNAIVATEAERYYRAMYRGRANTWNMRDQHMVDTLERLIEHLQLHGEQPRAVVWAHNSHLGDARATSMTFRGEWNIGQLMRERHAKETFNLGFTTYEGTVTAASDWGAPAERKRVRPGMQGSYEELLHLLDMPGFQVESRLAADLLPGGLLERAIGVIYRPETERFSHYFEARIAEQFDWIIHFDRTRAVEPLEPGNKWRKGDMPETYPSAL